MTYVCTRTCRYCNRSYTVYSTHRDAVGHRVGTCARCTSRHGTPRHVTVTLDLPSFPGARCAGQDPELWQAEAGGALEYAKLECADCPARVACLAWAMCHRECGTWGGLTEVERDRVRGAA